METRDIAQVDPAKVDEVFAEWDRTDSPGCAVGVIDSGELVYARGYGMANLDLDEPLSPASILHVASLSKQFTAASTAMLASEGKLSLEDDIRQYVPEMPDLGHTIRLRHLIHHTSGLRDQYGLFRLAGWRDEDLQTFHDVLDFAYHHRRLNFEPGTEYAYCNTSYTLLALTIERVSGQSFRAFVRERVFAPLGMLHSRFLDDVTEIVPNRASAYAPREGAGFKRADSNVEAVGAICLYTSVEDLAHWVRNFKTRAVAGEILDDAMIPGALNDGSSQGYGYGLGLGCYRGLRTVSHGGVDSGYRAEMLWFPEVDFGVVILANLSTIKPGWLARKVADACLGDRLCEDELLDAPSINLPHEDLIALTGIYRDERRSLTRDVRVADGKFVVNAAFGEPMELDPFGNGRFRLGTPPTEIRIRPGADGQMKYHEVYPDGKTNVYARIDPVLPGEEGLAQYTGSYWCPEISTRYTIDVNDGKLVIRHRKIKDRALEPTIEDGFAAPPFDVIFSRNDLDEVDGFDFFSERIRYLHFEREC